MRLLLWFYIYTILLITLGLITMPNYLNGIDGTQHFKFSNEPNCGSGYANGVCILTTYFSGSEFLFWLFFYIISIIGLPLLIYFYTKEPLIFPAWFLFSGFFFVEETMQVYAQLLLGVILIYYLFSKNNKQKIGVGIVLFITAWFNIFLIHRLEIPFLIAIGIIELFVYFKISERLVLFCGLFSRDLINKIGEGENYFRSSINNNSGSLFQNLIYYGFSFFYENMFILFSLIAIKECLRPENKKYLYYFILILFTALGSWVYLGWSNWYVTRILLFVPLVLIVPFINWFNRQNTFVKNSMLVIGFLYFLSGLVLFIQKKTELQC